jgi:hypothetical protein
VKGTGANWELQAPQVPGAPFYYNTAAKLNGDEETRIKYELSMPFDAKEGQMWLDRYLGRTPAGKTKKEMALDAAAAAKAQQNLPAKIDLSTRAGPESVEGGFHPGNLAPNGFLGSDG